MSITNKMHFIAMAGRGWVIQDPYVPVVRQCGSLGWRHKKLPKLVALDQLWRVVTLHFRSIDFNEQNKKRVPSRRLISLLNFYQTDDAATRVPLDIESLKKRLVGTYPVQGHPDWRTCTLFFIGVFRQPSRLSTVFAGFDRHTSCSLSRQLNTIVQLSGQAWVSMWGEFVLCWSIQAHETWWLGMW